MPRLDPALAARFITLTLGHLGRQYPYKPDLVLAGPEDAVPPIAHHPLFHGSFDWHSCVHGWWQVLRLSRRFPDLAEAAAVRTRAAAMLTAANVAGECAFLDRPSARGFERPYGWGWLLALDAEARCHDAPWRAALEPLAQRIAARFHEFLPKLDYPIRVGTHFNIAFALIHARGWAESRDPRLVALIDARARDWFAGDADCQAWEPGGDEFLSGTLCEALLMARVLPAADFASWFGRFLPRAAAADPATLFTPARVSDRSDGKIAHLDGLNLSRAWCWREIAAALDPADPLRARARDTAARHLAAALPHIASDYMGEHWLASFALLALEAGGG